MYQCRLWSSSHSGQPMSTTCSDSDSVVSPPVTGVDAVTVHLHLEVPALAVPNEYQAYIIYMYVDLVLGFVVPL